MRILLSFILVSMAILTACAKAEYRNIIPQHKFITTSSHEDFRDDCQGSGVIEFSGLDINDNLCLDTEEITHIVVTCYTIDPDAIDSEEDGEDFHCKKHANIHSCIKKDHREKK